MPLNIDNWIIFSALAILYLVFLLYDVFKRGDNWGQYAYIVAIIPANFLWYMYTPDNTEWGPLGAMTILTGMWILCVIRDIFIKNKEKGYKDADDVALFLVMGNIIQIILTAILPISVPSMQAGTYPILSYFYLPTYNPLDPTFAYLAWDTYRILVTVLILSIIIPIIIDLKAAKVSFLALILLEIIFALPFLYVAFLWLREAPWPMFFLFMVLFFVFLLVITKSTKYEKVPQK
jgi:hypothetical protein